jgi:cytochrome b561
LLTLHESLGIAVVATMLFRPAHRRWARPPDPVSMPVWMHQAALATRLLLYFLLVFLPVSAIVGSWIEGTLSALILSAQLHRRGRHLRSLDNQY